MNRVTILGRLGKDPETTSFDNGSVTSFSVASSETYKDKQGQRKEKTDWHNVSFWGKQGEVVAKYFKKGDSILLEGKLSYREYEKDGVKHSVTEILGKSFEFIPRSNGKSSSNDSIPEPVDISGGADDDDLPF